MRNIRKLQSDEADIALITDRIVVMEYGVAEVHLTDGKVQNYIFPEFHPAQYKAERQKEKDKKKKPARKPMTKIPTVITLCENCGESIQQYAGRKQKKFCCSECRNQWWNQHLDRVKRKTYYEITCQHCGKVTTVYGDSRRKYCSHERYIADRFGKGK